MEDNQQEARMNAHETGLGEEMDLREIKARVDMVTTIARSISVEEAQVVVNEIARTETLTPILDPTWFRANMTNLDHHQRVARAFLAFRQEVESVLQEELVAKQGRGD